MAQLLRQHKKKGTYNGVVCNASRPHETNRETKTKRAIDKVYRFATTTNETQNETVQWNGCNGSRRTRNETKHETVLQWSGCRASATARNETITAGWM